MTVGTGKGVGRKCKENGEGYQGRRGRFWAGSGWLWSSISLTESPVVGAGSGYLKQGVACMGILEWTLNAVGMAEARWLRALQWKVSS